MLPGLLAPAFPALPGCAASSGPASRVLAALARAAKIFSGRGPSAVLGEVAVVPEGLIFAADRNLAAIRLGRTVLSGYLEAILRSPRLQKVLAAGSGSTAQPHLYLKDLRDLRIPIPTIAMQEELLTRLGEQLSRIDQVETDVDTSGKRAIALRSAVLAAAFSGTLVPQDRSEESASVLLERIAAKRSASDDRQPTRPRNSHRRRRQVTA